MMNYQITYEDALKLCEAYKNFNFYKTEYRIGAYRIVTFNYFLCEYRHFVMPLEELPHIHARDMRGVTFVFNEDGSLFKRFLMLEKFFNSNQVEETQLDKVKDKHIRYITNKEDGSLVAFMSLPNGKVFAKTQGGFDNEQAINAMKLYETQENVKEFVNIALGTGCTPLFEYVSYDNRIVLKYNTKELKLIGIRNNATGEYYSIPTLLKIGWNINVSCVSVLSVKSFDELMEIMQTSEDIEGVVIEFEDGQMIKMKTLWYFNLHGLRTENIFREDYVIKNYLTGKLDDITQELNNIDDADAYIFIDKVKNAVNKWSNFIDTKVDLLVADYSNYDKWGAFAFANHKQAFFNLARIKIQTPEDYAKRKVDYMLNAAKRFKEAKNIIEKWK